MSEPTETMEQPMEQPVVQPAAQPVNASNGGTTAPYPEVRKNASISPQAGGGGCGCGGAAGMGENGMGANGMGMASYVYAIGRVEARFPNLAAEKEFAQATGRADTAGKTDQQAFHEVLSQRQNRYLVRQLCWVLTVQGMETYLLQPRDPADIDMLIDAIRPAPAPQDIDVVIGVRGPIAPPEMCNGLMVPIVVFDQIYSFGRDEFIKAIPKPEKMTEEQFSPAAEELFDRIMHMTDNAGATDEHRALNYLAMRYPTIYAKAAEEFAGEFFPDGSGSASLRFKQRAQHC